MRGCDEPLILRRLLSESLARLRAGRGVEKDHGVVHPEVSCIVRDCARLAQRLNALVAGKADGEVMVDAGEVDGPEAETLGLGGDEVDVGAVMLGEPSGPASAPSKMKSR